MSNKFYGTVLTSCLVLCFLCLTIMFFQALHEETVNNTFIDSVEYVDCYIKPGFLGSSYHVIVKYQDDLYDVVGQKCYTGALYYASADGVSVKGKFTKVNGKLHLLDLSFGG